MELSEVVSANVALPVLGVVIFALFVFTYGFKSPPQPPSFDFEDERKQNQKRGKKGKQLKGQTNGHVVAEVHEETGSKPPTPKVTKPSPKAKPSDGKSPKTETATPKTEGKKEKSKKVAIDVQDEVKTKGGSSASTGKGKRTEEEDGQWETQRSRKDKKQKPKKDEKTGKVDSDERRKSEEMELDNGSAPADQKTKKKKKVSKAKPVEEPKIQPVRAVFTGEAAAAPEAIKIDVEKPMSASGVQDRVTEEFEVSQSKKNKKKEKKTIPVATAVAVTPQATNKDAAQATNKDAAQATTKDSKDTSSIRKAKMDQAKEVLPPAEVKPATSPKKKKGKSDSGDTGVAAQQAKEEHVMNVKPAEDIKAAEPIKVKAAKSEKNKVSASKPAAASKSQASATVETKPAAALESRAPPPETATTEPSATKPVAPVSFDELGGSSDSWTEAPKSKKKRPRREN